MPERQLLETAMIWEMTKRCGVTYITVIPAQAGIHKSDKIWIEINPLRVIFINQSDFPLTFPFL